MPCSACKPICRSIRRRFANVSPDSAFNTALSFVTNTNWQGYGGESTMSYLTQMLALAVQNFLSAATGIVVVIALIRGFARHSAKTVGNAWVDLTRITLHVLLPISIVYAVFLTSQGVIQNFDAYKDVTTLEVTKYDNPKVDAAGQPLKDDKGVAITEPAETPTQTLAMGPVASQEAIKMLGTNGGGFINANSAHPYENPTPLTNFIQMLSIFLIPAALCFTFGRMVGDTRQGWAVLAAMTLMFVALAYAAMHFEQQANPLLTQLGVDPAAGNMEGKETRFGIAESGLFATITTLASCGAVNAMHDSFTPLGGLVPLIDMQLGEVVFGGVGTGLYGMLVFAIMAVFIAGLMIGRTPEYLGKKIEAFEMKMVSIAILVTPLLVLVGTAIAVMARRRQGRHRQPGRPWLLGNPLCLHLGRQQQRQRLRRPVRQHAVLQRDARHCHVVRPLRRDRAGAGHCRFAGRQEAHRRRCRHPADAWPAVRHAADRHRAAGRPPELRPGAGPRPRHRAPRALGRSLSLGEKIMTRKTFTLFDPALAVAGHRRCLPETESGRAMAQSGDVRRLRRQHPDHHALAAGPGGQGEAPAGFILAIAIWLWFTVLFANFAEALAEGRSKAQAASLRGLKKETWAKKLARAAAMAPSGK